MNILKNRFIYLWISAFFFITSVLLILIPKLNLGIDMTWWINLEYSYENSINIEPVKSDLKEIADEMTLKWSNVINNISVYWITWEKSLAITVWFYNWIEEKELEVLKNNFRNQTFDIISWYDSTAEEIRYTNIWKSFWDYIKDTAFLTLFLAIVAITFYVTFAFSWVVSWISVFSFAVITIITLFHDVVISSWMYIFASMYSPEFQIDTFFITALLTILGYSINDTIVVFDRVRSNLKKFWWIKWKEAKDLYEIINLSINETITRSIYTSLTLLFVLISVFLFGPETIKWFILIMIFGTIIGTYSSIFIASPILYQVNKNKKLTVYKKEEIKIEDKIVV